jgi:hypothetical protein
MKIGDLVMLCSWTKFPGEVGQIIDLLRNDKALILVRGEVMTFLGCDYDSTIEFYR